MADNFGLKIGIEGEKEFKKALSEINQSFKVLGSEMKLVSSQFDKNDKSVQALSARNTVLNKEIEAQKNKVETLRAALQNAADSFGENDRRTQNWQIQLNNAEAALNSMERELSDNERAIEALSQEETDAADATERLSREIAPQEGALAEEEGEYPHGAHCLAANGGERRALAPHAETVNEDWIEDDVEGRADEDGHHAGLGEALTGNVVVQAEGELYGGRAEQVERKVVHRVADGLFAGPEHEQHGPHGQEAQPRQHEGHEQKKDAGRADDALGLGVVATPHRDGGQRRPAHARQKREGRNNEDDGKGDAEPRQRQWPDVRYPAHKDAVHDVVEKVDDLGQDTGHGKAHEEPAERLGRQRAGGILRSHCAVSFLKRARRTGGTPLHECAVRN